MAVIRIGPLTQTLAERVSATVIRGYVYWDEKHFKSMFSKSSGDLIVHLEEHENLPIRDDFLLSVRRIMRSMGIDAPSVSHYRGTIPPDNPVFVHSNESPPPLPYMEVVSVNRLHASIMPRSVFLQCWAMSPPDLDKSKLVRRLYSVLFNDFGEKRDSDLSTSCDDVNKSGKDMPCGFCIHRSPLNNPLFISGKNPCPTRRNGFTIQKKSQGWNPEADPAVKDLAAHIANIYEEDIVKHDGVVYTWHNGGWFPWSELDTNGLLSHARFPAEKQFTHKVFSRLLARAPIRIKELEEHSLTSGIWFADCAFLRHGRFLPWTIQEDVNPRKGAYALGATLPWRYYPMDMEKEVLPPDDILRLFAQAASDVTDNKLPNFIRVFGTSTQLGHLSIGLRRLLAGNKVLADIRTSVPREWKREMKYEDKRCTRILLDRRYEEPPDMEFESITIPEECDLSYLELRDTNYLTNLAVVGIPAFRRKLE